jgi:hypothetical protein
MNNPDPVTEHIFLERVSSRLLIAILCVSILVGSVVISLLITLDKKDELISELTKNRIMYGILSSDGRYFESVSEIPSRIVRNYARSFILDWANFTPDTIQDNRNSAYSKLDVEYKKLLKSTSDRFVTQVIATAFSQQFIPKTYKATPRKDGILEITFEGTRAQWQNGNTMGEVGKVYKVEYSIHMKKTLPTETTPEGLEIVKVIEPREGFN